MPIASVTVETARPQMSIRPSSWEAAHGRTSRPAPTTTWDSDRASLAESQSGTASEDEQEAAAFNDPSDASEDGALEGPL